MFARLRILPHALLLLALLNGRPLAAGSPTVHPVMGPVIPFTGSRNIPNLSLLAAPRTGDDRSESTHEGEEYWRAARRHAALQNETAPPPELNRLIVKAFHEKRLATRENGPHPLVSAGWRSLGPTDHAGRVNQYRFTPDGGKLYIATSNGGIWLLTRQGGDYVNPRNLTEDLPLLTFGAIGIAPSSPNVIYAATGEQSPNSLNVVYGLGTLRSTDAGNSWAFNTVSVTGGLSETVPGLYSYDLNVNPNDPNDVLLGTETGIFRSRDGGQRWVNVLAHQNDNRQGERFLRRPDDPRVVWCALQGGLAYTVDGGDTWHVIFEDIATQMGYDGIAIRTTISWSESKPDRMYWLVAGFNNGTGKYDQIGVFRTDDGGDNWKTACGPPGTNGACPAIAGTQGWTALSMAADPLNADVVFVGGLDVWRSADGGVTWTQISEWTLPERHPQYCHADIRTLTFEPGVSNLWVGSDGGLFRSLDGGKTFLWKNDGIVTRMFTSVAQHPTDPYTLFAGMQDNGSQKLSGNSTTAWKQVYGGDGFDAAVNPSNPNIVYVTLYEGRTARASDGGQSSESFTEITCPDSAQSFYDCPLQAVTSFRTRLVIYPSDPRVLLTMTNSIYYTTNGGADANGNPDPNDWKRIYAGTFCSDGYHDEDCKDLSPPLSYATGTAIGLDPRDTNRCALGTRPGYIVYTLDDFSHSTIYRGLPEQQNAIVWDPDDPHAFYVGLESSVDGHTLYRVSGLDTSSPTATPMDEGLAVPITYAGGSFLWYAPVDALAISPVDSRRMFAGTKYGIFRSTDKGASWAYYGDDFPATWVSALLFTPDGSLLRAATWGRGMWEIAANGGPIVPSAPPSPAFHFDPPSPRPGQTVSFTDESTGGASSWSWSFGDGTTSSAQSPTHVYAAPGTYTARLSASNAAGTASTTRSVPVSFGSTGTGAAFTYLLPVIVTTSGENGTVFTTETSFTNRSGRVLTLTFRAKGSTFESSSTYALAAGQEIHGDVVAFLRTTGMSLPAGSVVASLRIEVVGADDLSQFGALARVTTPPNASLLSQGIRGRFGLAFPAMPLGRAASSEAIVYGLQDTSEPGSAGTRSNLACVSAGGNGTLQLEATYHDGDTGQDAPGPDVFTLSPFQFDQRNRPLKARGITHGYVRIRRVSGNDQFVCYAVLNDNLNGDGAFVPMVANDAASPTSSAILPVIVDTAGFRSEMTVANRTQRSIAALFAVIRADDPVPDWGYYNFDPGEQTTIADIAQDLRDAGFDLPSGSVASVYLEFLDGTLHDDQSDTQTPIPTSEGYVGVRTYQERAGGLFGLAYGYAPLGSSADTVAFVYGLQQTGAKGSSAGTRSNLAVVHALGGNVEPLTLEVTYYGPNGAELGKEPPLTLQPGEWHQFNAPLAPFGVPHGFARIRRLSGSDQFLAYGVLNDQLNDDGSYVPMVTP